MIRKNKIIAICCLAILLTSFSLVKKKENESAFVVNPVLNGNIVDGVFRVNKVIVENFRGQSIFTKYLVTAVFPTDTLGDISFANRKYAGVVNVNNSAMHYYDNFQIYIDTTFDLSTANGFYWNISGSLLVDTFKYTNANQIPNFNYSNINLPTEIDTAIDLVIRLSEISYTDSIFVSLTRADSVAKPPFTIKRFSSSSNILIVEKQYLKQYSPGQSLSLQIELDNYNN